MVSFFCEALSHDTEIRSFYETIQDYFLFFFGQTVFTREKSSSEAAYCNPNWETSTVVSSPNIISAMTLPVPKLILIPHGP